MTIDLSSDVKRTNSTRTVEAVLEMESFVLPSGAAYPLTEKQPILLSIENREDRELTITGEIRFVALIGCDRCLAEVRTPIHFSIDRHLKIARDRQGGSRERETCVGTDTAVLIDEEMEGSDDLDGFVLDVERLACTEILVNWPGKVLCREDCKGICGSCGKNLNEGPCGCQDTKTDPRMAAIQDVFSKFKEV